MMSFLDSIPHELSLFGIMAIQAMGLQLIVGGAGLLSLGHAAYFTIGGYSSGIFALFIAPQLGIVHPLPLLICAITFAFLMSAFAGLIVAVPCLRLSGDYLAIATLGFGEIVSTILQNVELVGGTRGFKDIPKLSSPFLIWVAAAVIILFLTRFYKTQIGFSIKATRDCEIAARSVGISTRKSKITAFVLGAALAGISGAFYVHTIQFISPEAAGFTQSVEVLLAVVLGGMFSLWGSILGAFIMVFVPALLRFAPEIIRDHRMTIFAVIVILIMLINPSGISALFNRLKMGRKTHAK